MHLRIYISLLLLIVLACSAKAQKEITVVGEYQSEWLTSESKDQAHKRIKDQAIINALEKAFGKPIFQGNTTYIKNNENGGLTETKTGFNMVADSYVKGEVIEELNTEFKEYKGSKAISNEKKEYIEIKCIIKVKAREFIEPPLNFMTYTLNCVNIENCKTTNFKNNDNFYLYFKSPVNGYLAVFLDDNTSSSVLIPYSYNRTKYIQGFPVEASKEYILFYNDKKYCLSDMLIDELSWESSSGLEKLCILFSTIPFTLPDFNKNNESNSEVSLPQNIPSEDFMKWVIKKRMENKSMQYSIIYIQSVK